MAEEMLPFREMVEHYRGQTRGIFAYVGQKPKPHEMYLLPPCPLASMVLASARQAAGPDLEARIPLAVSADQLLAVIIYRKVSARLPIAIRVEKLEAPQGPHTGSRTAQKGLGLLLLQWMSSAMNFTSGNEVEERGLQRLRG